MIIANPYLHFNGNCEEAFNFYKSVFDGEFEMVSRYKDAPMQNSQPESESEKIMHISLPIGPKSILMGSDIPGAFPRAIQGSNYYIMLNTESEAEAIRIFTRLSAEGNIAMPLDKTFWGAFFGMLIDKYGIQWMVSYDYK
jgi:PhnB protein